MNTLEGIIEDVNKSNLVSDKVIKKVRELIGQEKWNDLYDEESDIITTTGELLITLKSTKELQEENKILARHILELQADKGALTDKVSDLENKLANADYQLEGRDLEIKELKAQVEKTKCCAKCSHCNTYITTCIPHKHFVRLEEVCEDFELRR